MLRTDQFSPLPTSVKLRICDGDGERIVPASVNAVELALAPGVAMRAGTEISLTHGGASLVAVALPTREADAGEAAVEFMLWSFNGEHASLAGPLRRSEALQQFRQFILTAAPQKAGQNGRAYR